MALLPTVSKDEVKVISDVLKNEFSQTHCRDEVTLGSDAGLSIGDVVELISSEFVKVVTAGNAAGVFLSKANPTLVAATAEVTFAANPITTETITINGRVYQFLATPLADADVDVGSDADGSADNLMACINASGVSGTQYFATTVNADVSAEIRPGDTLRFRALIPGTAGNAITLATDITGATLSSATLIGGQSVDPATGVVILRGPATLDGTQLNYNGSTKATVDAALLALGLKIIG